MMPDHAEVLSDLMQVDRQVSVVLKPILDGFVKDMQGGFFTKFLVCGETFFGNDFRSPSGMESDGRTCIWGQTESDEGGT